MLYKPTYCCDCGERIERTEWNILTSWRFCELCETQHGFDIWAYRLAGLSLVFIGLFGTGAYLSSSPKNLKITRVGGVGLRNSAQVDPGSKVNPRESGKPRKTLKSNKILRAQQERQTREANESDVYLNKNQASKKPVTRKRRAQKVTSEPVFMCGAATKKGSPCSRKVKGGGRCWQHEGKEALLPKGKLLVKK